MNRQQVCSLVLGVFITACGSSDQFQQLQNAKSGVKPLTSPDLPARLRDMPEQWKQYLEQYHGWFDHEYSAIYEQWQNGWLTEDEAESNEDTPGGFDVRMSNPSFSGGQNEFQIAINPANPLYAIAASNDSRHAGVGIYATSDQGLTWSAQDAPLGGGCCDPAAVYGSDGVAYVGILGNPTNTLRSEDNGASWQLKTPVSVPDRNNLVVDPRDSNVVWITYTDLNGASGSNRIKGYRSTDGGSTWSPSFFVGDVAPPQGYEQSSQPRIHADGTVYVGYQQYLNSSEGCNAGVQNVLARSTDDGQTWSYTVLDIIQGGACTSTQAGRGIFCISATQSFRSRSHPIIGIDPFDSNIVYMVYSGGDLELPYTCGAATGYHSDTLFRRSTDGGATFTDPIPINQDGQGSDQYYPWVDVDEVGTIYVGWNDRREDPQNFQSRWYEAYSVDHGDTWYEYPIADQWTRASTFIGDYHGLAAQRGLLMGMWYDTRNNTSGDPYTHPLTY